MPTAQFNSAHSIVQTQTMSQLSGRPRVLERKVTLTTRPDIHIVQTGRMAPDGTPSREHTLLMLSGIVGVAWTDFRPQLERLGYLLPDHWSLIAWDPPGRGQSIPPHDVLPIDVFERHAEAAADLMEALHVESYAVMGWSGGGRSAMFLAALRPQNVKALVLVTTSPYLLPHQVAYFDAIRDLKDWPPALLDPFLEYMTVDELRHVWSECYNGMERISQHNNGDVCSHVLADIRAATLIVHGVNDPMITATIQHSLCKAISDTEYVEIEGGKHNVHLRYAENFNRIVGEFLQRRMG